MSYVLSIRWGILSAQQVVGFEEEENESDVLN